MSYDPLEYWTARGRNWPYETYENDERHRLVKKHLREILEECKPRDLLDVGCGSGYFFEVFKEFPATKVFGIDFSPTMLEHAKTQIKRVGATNITLSCRDIREINVETFPEFDMILSKNCLMHILPKDIISVVNNLRTIAGKWIILIEYVGITEGLNPTNFGHPYMILFEGLHLRRTKNYDNNRLFWWEQPWLSSQT